MKSQFVEIIEGGKLAIPAQFRRELGIEVGDTVIVELADGALQIRPLESAIRRAQAIVRGFVPAGASLVDDLIDGRRAEAGRE